MEIVNSKEIEELRWNDVSIDSGSITTDLSNEDSRECDVKLEFNEQVEGNFEVDHPEKVLFIKRYICNGKEKIVLRPERSNNDSSKMDNPSLVDVKIELIDTSNSSLDGFRRGDNKMEQFEDEEGTIWMKENEDFLLEDREYNIKREIDDSFPEYIEHHYTAEQMEEGDNLVNVYCKYCENNVLSKSLTTHLNDCHKDAYSIEKIQKHINCRFCGNDVFSKNLMRHLERHHYEENEVQKILMYPKNSKERRRALCLFRNSTDFDLFVTGEKRPYRMINRDYDSNEYSSCVNCKDVYTKKDFENHRKFCILKEKNLELSKNLEKGNHLPSSQSIIKCDVNHVDIISRLNIKEQVFHLMKQDLIASEAKRDIVIAHVGEHYLNNLNNKHETHTVISRMRELSCLLIAYRALVKEQNLRFTDIIDPNNFSNVVRTVKIIAGYDYTRNAFNCPKLATNVYDSLKLVCTVLVNLISTENLDEAMLGNKIEWIQKVDHFKNLIETQWNAEVLSIKDVKLPEKVETKSSLLHLPVHSKQESPKKVPKQYSLFHLAANLKQFQDEVLRIAYQCQEELFTNINNEESYRLLVQASLALLYISNKQNVEVIQYMLIEHYLDDKNTKYIDSELSHVERVLTTKHKRVLVSKNTEESVLILIPYIIQCFVNVLLKYRDKYMETENRYIFAMPGSNVEWGESEAAIRNLCETIKLEEKIIGDKRFRKYTAIIIGILNLSQGELQQLGHFMRCVLESNNKFFELPLDAYQTAKLSRLLQIMEEQPILSKYKGKCLAEIDIDPNDEFACEDNGEGENVGSLPIGDDPDVMDRIENSTDNMKRISENKQLDEKTSPNWKNENDHPSEKGQSVSVISFERLYDESYRDELHNTEKDLELRRKSIDDIGCKRGWTNEEIELIGKEYRCCIENGVYPSGKEMNKFLMVNNITKTVPSLRSKIQHLMRIKNKLQFC